MITLMLITNDSNLAYLAVEAGVDRIFIDLEVIGKYERQGQRDTVISHHTMDDVAKIRNRVPLAQLLVRLNPYHEGTPVEVEEALARGADLLMLPMFHSVEELRSLATLVQGRAGIVPLVETPEAMECLEEVLHVHGIAEVYIGLNDLHIACGLHFMFEPLVNGMVERMAGLSRKAGIPFGFGGIARIGEGELPGELVLAEHLRLGSQCVLLSRTFHRGVLSDAKRFQFEIAKLREMEDDLLKRPPERIELDRQKVHRIVQLIVASVHKNQSGN